MDNFDTIWEERFLNLISDISTYYKRHSGVPISEWMKNSVISFQNNKNSKISTAAKNCIRQLDVLHIRIAQSGSSIDPIKEKENIHDNGIIASNKSQQHEELNHLISALFQSCNDFNKKHIDLNLSLLKKYPVTIDLLKELKAVERVKDLKKQIGDATLQQQLQQLLNTWKETCLQNTVTNKTILRSNLSSVTSRSKAPSPIVVDKYIPPKNPVQKKITKQTVFIPVTPTSCTQTNSISNRNRLDSSIKNNVKPMNLSKPSEQTKKVKIVSKLGSTHTSNTVPKRRPIRVDDLFADEDDDDFIVYDDNDKSNESIHKQIKNMFGTKEYYDDDGDDMNMESTVNDIENEEKRSRYYGRKEDAEELAKIQEEERREALRKK